MIYEGNRLFCNECKYCPRMSVKDGKIKISPCPMIDHEKIRLLEPLFNTRHGGVQNTDICGHFKPANWCTSVKNTWTGIDDYIEFMDKEYYSTPDFLDYNKLRDKMYIGLVTGSDIDRWGDYYYQVSLYDWLTGNAVKDNKVKYRYKYKIIRTKSGKAKNKEKVGEFGVDMIE